MKKLISALVCAALLTSSLAPSVFSFGVQEKCPAVDDGEILKNWVIWNVKGSSDELIRPDGSKSNFDFVTPAEKGINLINIYFTPFEENGKRIYAVPNSAAVAEECEKMKYEIGKAHEKGMKVIAYSDDVQFPPLEARRMGIDPDEITATNGNKMLSCDMWFPDPVNLACINAPAWRDWLRENVKIIAEAGFDGIQYDAQPYLIEGYFCDCKYCREAWSHYKEDTLGADKDIPDNYLDYSDECDREYMLWRAQCMIDFTRDTLSEAKKVNPDFIFIQNENYGTFTFPFEALADGCWDMASSEYGGINIGYNSSLFMYQMCESFGYHDLLGLINTYDQVTPTWRYKIALAEAYAVNGGLTVTTMDETDQYIPFLDSHKELFLDTKSANRTALLYSAESNLFSMGIFDANNMGGTLTAEKDVARSFSTVMTKHQIPHDFVCVEKEGVLDALDRYDVFVIPNYTYINGETWDAVLEKLAESEKTVIVGGNEVKEAVGPLISGANVKYYKGKLRDSFADMFDETPADRVTMLCNENGTEVNVRRTDEDHEILHLIRLGGDDAFDRRDAELEYTIPEGKTVKSVKVYCPFTEGNDIASTWEMRGDKVCIDTEDFDTNAVISLEYEESPEPTYIPGDINSDGTVNAKDASALSKHLAGWTITIDESASDVTSDGTVNGKDLALLLKYLAGWKVSFAN